MIGFMREREYEVGCIPYVQARRTHSSMHLSSTNIIGKWGTLHSQVFGALLHINMKLVHTSARRSNSRMSCFQMKFVRIAPNFSIMNISVSAVVYMASVRLLSLLPLCRSEQSSPIELRRNEI
jgi:hypothetical protein